MRKAYTRMGVMSIVFGLFFFFAMQIMVMDTMPAGVLQIPALMLIVLGVICLVSAFRLPAPPGKPKKKKPDLMDFINETRHR